MKNPATHVYGIPNCGSVKKVRVWLEEQGHHYQFHDFKKEGVDPAALDHWLSQVSWETLVNRKGTTWRQLDASVQAKVSDAASARSLMLAHPCHQTAGAGGRRRPPGERWRQRRGLVPRYDLRPD